MAKAPVDVSKVLTSATATIELCKEAAVLTEKLAEKGTGNEPDGLAPNTLARLSDAVHTLAENQRTLAEAVAEIQKP